MEASASAFREAARLDPLPGIALWITALVATATVTILAGAARDGGSRFRPNPADWSQPFVVLLVIACVLALLTFVGVYDLIWVKRDLRLRLDGSLMGAVARSLEFRRKRDFNSALAGARQLIERVPTWPWPFALQSDCYLSLNRPEEALSSIDRAILLDPENPWHQVLRGRALLQTADLETALEVLERAAADLPGQADVLRSKGIALIQLGRREEALECFAAAISSAPDDSHLRLDRARSLMGEASYHDQHGPTAALIDIILDDNRSSVVRVLSDEGRRHLSARELDLAVSDFDIVLGQDPANRTARASRAAAYLQQGRQELADAEFEHSRASADRSSLIEIIKIQSQAYDAIGDHERVIHFRTELLDIEPSPRNLLLRGLRLEVVGRLEAARDDFQAAVEMDDTYADAFSHLASVLRQLGDEAAATDAFARALVLAPTIPHTYEVEARTLAMSGRHREAEDLCDKGLALAPSNVSMRTLRASLRIDLSAYSGALDDLGIAQEIAPEAVQIYLTRSRLHHVIGDPHAAAEELTLALAMPTMSIGLRLGAHLSRAAANRLQGNLDAARDDVEAALALHPQHADALVFRACLALEAKELGAARRDLEVALEAKPHFAPALLHLLQVEAREQNHDALRQVLSQLESAQPPLKDMKQVQADMYFELRDFARAADAYREMLLTRVDDAALTRRCAMAYDNAGDFKNAELMFRKLLSSENGADPRVRLYHAVTLSQQGQRDAAIAAFVELHENVGSAAFEALVSSSLDPEILLEGERVTADVAAVLHRTHYDSTPS